MNDRAGAGRLTGNAGAGRIAAWAALAAVLIGIVVTAVLGASAPKPCESVCRSCDMAIWRALELKLEEPELFTRDRLFALQAPLFPPVFSLALNRLHDITGDASVSDQILKALLGVLFITGVFALARSLAGDAVVTAVVTLLAGIAHRLPLSGVPVWGLPHLKPLEVVGAATPWLLVLLHRSLNGRRYFAAFAAGSALLLYVHPPTALVLIAIGGGTFVAAGHGRAWFRGDLTIGAVLYLVVTAPFLLGKAGMPLGDGPPLSILLERTAYAFFPTRATLLTLFSDLALPLLTLLVLYRGVSRRLDQASRSFIAWIAILGGALTLLSAATYAWTGLARFVLPSASRYVYVSAYVVLGLALRHWRELPPRTRLVVAIAAVGITLELDTRAFDLLQRFRNRHETAPAGGESAFGTPGSHDPCALAEAGRWAAENTDVEALFLVPPRRVDAGFRVLSRRAVVVVDKDGGNAKYGGDIAREWAVRMKDVEAAYAAGTPEALTNVARKYGAQYVLAERGEAPPAGAAFANSSWMIVATGVGPP